MEIQVLGCSTSWTERFTSCYLINDNILMDCGADAVKAYLKSGKRLDEIKTFLVSHFHADHFFGLTIFLTYHYRYSKKDGLLKPKIYGLKGIKEKCEQIFEITNMFSCNLADYFDFIELENNDKFIVDNLEISCLMMDHGDVEDLGYLIKEDEFTFGYSGDTTHCENLEKLIRKSDMCFIDCARENSTPKHLGIDGFLFMKNKYPNKKIYATHCDESVYTNNLIKDYLVKENDIFVNYGKCVQIQKKYAI